MFELLFNSEIIDNKVLRRPPQIPNKFLKNLSCLIKFGRAELKKKPILSPIEYNNTIHISYSNSILAVNKKVNGISSKWELIKHPNDQIL